VCVITTHQSSRVHRILAHRQEAPREWMHAVPAPPSGTSVRRPRRHQLVLLDARSTAATLSGFHRQPGVRGGRRALLRRRRRHAPAPGRWHQGVPRRVVVGDPRRAPVRGAEDAAAAAVGSVPLAPHLADVRDALVGRRPWPSRFLCIRGPLGPARTPCCRKKKLLTMAFSRPTIDKSVGNPTRSVCRAHL